MKIVLRSTHALTAAGSTASFLAVKVLIIFFLQESTIFEYNPLDFTDNLWGYAFITGQLDWIKPEFAFTIGGCDMDMNWFSPLVGIEMKSV
jgi:hypothetical protein